MALPEFDLEFAGPADWAAMYRAVGLQVVPSKEKRPYLSTWAELQNEIVPDMTFSRWYGAEGDFAKHNDMGILTGKCSDGVIVIDIDSHKTKAAEAWWRTLIEQENNGIEIETCIQITGGGGSQKLFRVPAGLYVPSIRTPIGVDIRGTGGFAVMPPTLHASGRRYQWVDGYAPWETEIADAPRWLLEAIEDLAEGHGGDQGPRAKAERTESPSGDYTAFGSRQDGREQEMYKAVWRAVLELYRQSPIQPTGAEQIRLSSEAYQVYENAVVSRMPGDKREGLEREGRGPTEWARKWRREMRNWGSAKMKVAAARPNPKADGNQGFDPNDFEQHKASAEQKADAEGKIFELLDVTQIKSQRDPLWLVHELIVEQSLGFIFGPPATLKSFIALDMALSFATGQTQWWGRTVAHHGAVIYISSEGHSTMKYRIAAWETHRKVTADAAPFYLIKQPINFMSAEDVGTLLATVNAVKTKTGLPVAAVFVDTVSRVLPGADENAQESMTMFVAACDAVRHRFNCVVVGIHHANKLGGMRGSTVIPAAGDFIVETTRGAGQMEGSLFARKIKDGVDGWEQPFKAVKVELPFDHSSLVVDPSDSVSMQPSNKSGWPDRQTCIEILHEIDTAWLAGKPLSNAINSPRSAVKFIKIKHRIEKALAREMLDTWLVEGVIEEAKFGQSHDNVRGLRRLVDLGK